MQKPMTATPETALDHDAEALYEALNNLVRVYQFRDRDRICCRDVSVTQCYALETLIHNGPMRLNALAELLWLDKSTASRVVDTLVRKQYVRRREDAEDRRAVTLEVTDSGRALHQDIRRGLIAEEREMLQTLPADVRAGAVDLLNRLAHAAAIRSGLTDANPADPKSARGCGG